MTASLAVSDALQQTNDKPLPTRLAWSGGINGRIAGAGRERFCLANHRAVHNSVAN